MPENDSWPGKVDEYRELKAEAAAHAERGDKNTAARWEIAAQVAGLTQVLDKIAYAARTGGAR